MRTDFSPEVLAWPADVLDRFEQALEPIVLHKPPFPESCQSCRLRPATTLVRFDDIAPVGVCGGCAPLAEVDGMVLAPVRGANGGATGGAKRCQICDSSGSTGRPVTRVGGVVAHKRCRDAALEELVAR